MQKLGLIALFSICWALEGYAYDEANVRTQCRSKIAGHYLTKLNKRDRLAEYVSLLKDKKQQFEKKLKTLRRDLTRLEARVQNEEFDVALARRRDGVEFQIRTMSQQVKESEESLIHYEDDLKSQTTSLQALKDKILKVFQFEKDPNVAGGGYGFRIVYKTECPKYRYICTLPVQEARDLLHIKIDGQVPVECQRYFNLSKIEY